MPGTVDAPLLDKILALLDRHRLGLRTDEVRTALGREGIDVPLADLASILRQSCEKGRIEFNNQKWRSTKAFLPPLPVRPEPTKSVSVKDFQIKNPPSPSQVQVGGKAITAIPIKPRIAKCDENSKEFSVEKGELASGWGLLRQLIPYYRECLRAEERPNMMSWAEKAGEQFLVLTASSRWWPEENDSIEFELDGSSLPGTFLKAISQRGDDEIFLGYPIETIPTKEGGTVVKPLLTLVCQVSMGAGGVHISIVPQLPDVNFGWLERVARSAQEAQKILEWVGIFTSSEDGEFDSAVEVPYLDMETAAVRLVAYMGNKNCERMSPTATRISLAINESRPTVQNAIILFLSDVTRFSKGAIRELNLLQGWQDNHYERTALGSLFLPKGDPDSKSVCPVLAPITLNEDQLNAVRDSLEKPITVITGPPGTGKSQAVAAIMASAALSGRSALVASKNHKALDAVEERLNELCKDRSILARANRPWGTEKGFDVKTAISSLLARGGVSGKKLRNVRQFEELSKLDERRWDLNEELRGRYDLELEVSHKHDELGSISEKYGKLACDWARILDKGISVPLNQPDQSWLTKFPFLGNFLRRIIRHRLLGHFEHLKIPWAEIGLDKPDISNLEKCTEALIALEQYRALSNEINELHSRLIHFPDRDEILSKLMDLNAAIEQRALGLFRDLPEALDEASSDEMSSLTEFRGSISVMDISQDEGPQASQLRKLWDDSLDAILSHFPLWAVTNLSIAGRLPLRPGIFDYLIIDEASACDIPSALPLLARAKRAVIVGDPAQLHHVTKITVNRERELLKKNGLLKVGIGRFVHRENSLFHLAASSPVASAHLLREHYRCHEEIADYFNQTFYGGRLRILTNVERLRPPRGTRPGMHWTDVKSQIFGAKSGCFSQGEIDAIASHLKSLFEELNFEGTVGIVTPFREQANRLMDRIQKELSSDIINQANLGAYTAHQFQGDARDVILVSLCVGPDIPPGSLTYLNQTANLMNVAISRARAVCHVFGNREFVNTCSIPHIAALGRLRKMSADAGNSVGQFESPWEERLFEALFRRGMEPISQYPIAGRRLDIALIKDGIKLDIEIDGEAFHREADGKRKASDHWRDHQLRGLGWHVKRYWVYQLKEDMEACVDDILRALNP